MASVIIERLYSAFLMREAIRAHQSSSELIRAHQRSSKRLYVRFDLRLVAQQEPHERFDWSGGCDPNATRRVLTHDPPEDGHGAKDLCMNSTSRPHWRSIKGTPIQFESDWIYGTPIRSMALQLDQWHSNPIRIHRSHSQSITIHRTPSLSIACTHTRTGFGPGSRRLTKSGVISAWLAGFPSASEASALDAL